MMNQLSAAELNSQKKCSTYLMVVDDLFPPKLRLFNRRKNAGKSVVVANQKHS